MTAAAWKDGMIGTGNPLARNLPHGLPQPVLQSIRSCHPSKQPLGGTMRAGFPIRLHRWRPRPADTKCLLSGHSYPAIEKGPRDYQLRVFSQGWGFHVAQSCRQLDPFHMIAAASSHETCLTASRAGAPPHDALARQLH